MKKSLLVLALVVSCKANAFDVKQFDCAVEEFFDVDIAIIKLLEITRFARIIPYMQKMGKIESENMLKEKVEELCAKMVV